MIAMQYSFTLPADYDMTIIERRIREKGPLLDGFPKLRFKAYLSARKTGPARSRENLYAPFYVWDHPDGLSNFLCGPGFDALAGAFGRPSVRTWIVWQASVSDHVATAAFATREILPIPPYASLADLRDREIGIATDEIEIAGALASVVAFEPTTWTQVRFRLWRDLPEVDLPHDTQVYQVGHVSLP